MSRIQLKPLFEKKVDPLTSLLRDIFKASNADFKIKTSKNGKYTSVSVKIVAKNPDLIIENYKKVADRIENVILL